MIILKCELHTGNGFVAAEGTGARRVDQDRGDINKSLKMAVKSAHIDATLRVAGLSELFTQDIEDMLAGQGRTRGIFQPATARSNPSAPAAQPSRNRIRLLRRPATAAEGACRQRPEPYHQRPGLRIQPHQPKSSTASSWTC